MLVADSLGLLNERTYRGCVCTNLPTVGAKYSLNYHLSSTECDGVRNLRTILIEGVAVDRLVRTIKCKRLPGLCLNQLAYSQPKILFELSLVQRVTGCET